MDLIDKLLLMINNLELKTLNELLRFNDPKDLKFCVYFKDKFHIYTGYDLSYQLSTSHLTLYINDLVLDLKLNELYYKESNIYIFYSIDTMVYHVINMNLIGIHKISLYELISFLLEYDLLSNE